MSSSTMIRSRTWVVAQRHAHANDQGEGTAAQPFRTIGAAAALAEPGDVVLVHEGIYRERVAPARGGTAERPIVYQAAPGERVCIRGSEVFQPAWEPMSGMAGVWRGSLDGVTFGAAAYHGLCDASVYGTYNPYHHHFNRTLIARPHAAAVAEKTRQVDQARAKLSHVQEMEPLMYDDARKRLEKLQHELEEMTRPRHRRHLTTLGQVFLDGQPLREVEMLEELARMPGTWMVDPEGRAILLHPPRDVRDLAAHEVELSVRHTVFAPLKRGLGYITVRGFIIEHAANHFPTWGLGGWAQAGMLSCRSGHHWVIQDNVIRHAKSVGLDCGSEGGATECKEYADTLSEGAHHQSLTQDARRVGYHLIQRNHICANGHCGLAGIGHYGTQVLQNVIEKNNCDGWSSPWWEFAGIKFHFFYDGRIEGNLIRDNEAHGIWIDNQWRGSRITRNVIVNNLWSGINVELGRGPVLIDHNIIALTRRGDGIYGHDCADITIAHNLLYGNANCGVWFAYATPRVKPEDGCWDIRILNNMILGNQGGAVGLPMPWTCAGRNVAEGNLYMGGGEYLDEGSGPRPPLFVLTNQTHMGQMPQFHAFPAMTAERVREMLAELLRKAGVPESRWPNLETWTPHAHVGFDLWQAVLGVDAGSRILSAIRDNLCATRLSFQCRFDESPAQVRCVPVAGVERDYFGQPLPAKPLPGPFQDLCLDEINHLLFWPVPEGK